MQLPAINACFKTVDCRRLDYFAKQSVPQICRSLEDEIFSILLPWDFFEVFEALTCHLIIDDLKAVALVNSIDIMSDLRIGHHTAEKKHHQKTIRLHMMQ